MTASLECVIKAIWAEIGAGYCSGNAKITPDVTQLEQFSDIVPRLEIQAHCRPKNDRRSPPLLSDIASRFEIRTGLLTHK